jgi:hypothetical protein
MCDLRRPLYLQPYVLRPERHRYKGPFHPGLPAERVGKLGDEGKWSCMLVRVAKKDAWRMQYTFGMLSFTPIFAE